MRRIAAFTILGTLLGVCEQPLAKHPEPAFRASIIMSDSANSLSHGRVGTRFNLWTLSELFVRVKVADLPQLTFLKLKFINPAGETILEETTAFSPDPRMKKVDDALLGPQANVFRAKRIAGGYALDREIAVAGSVLWRVPPLSGDWMVEASVTGMAETLTSPLQLVTR
jgi:hypothetical protein